MMKRNGGRAGMVNKGGGRAKSPDICEGTMLRKKVPEPQKKQTRSQVQQQLSEAPPPLQVQFFNGLDDLEDDSGVGSHPSQESQDSDSNSSLNTPPHSPSHSSYSEGLLSPYGNPQTPLSDPLTPLTPLAAEPSLPLMTHKNDGDLLVQDPLTPDYSSSSSQSKSSPESNSNEASDQTVPELPASTRRATRSTGGRGDDQQLLEESPKRNIRVRTIEQILSPDYQPTPSTHPNIPQPQSLINSVTEPTRAPKSPRNGQRAPVSPDINTLGGRSPRSSSRKRSWLPKTTLNLSESSSDEEEEEPTKRVKRAGASLSPDIVKKPIPPTAEKAPPSEIHSTQVVNTRPIRKTRSEVSTTPSKQHPIVEKSPTSTPTSPLRKKPLVATVHPQPQKKSVSFDEKVMAKSPSPPAALTALLRSQKEKNTCKEIVPVGDTIMTDDSGSYRAFFQKNFEGRIADRPGKIISLEIFQIMCHTHFQQTWHKGVNYIIGENGSGKSAILTALFLGLGAKAFITGRAYCCKKCIQYGKNWAKVIVTLSNDGTLALEKYGYQIVIVRHLWASGVSRYQIKTAEGTMRSLDRKELERILVTLQIMPDNPMQFLNQDMARNFLRPSSCDPKKTYLIWHRAMLLTPSEALLEKSIADIQSAKGTMLLKQKMLEDLQQNTADLEKKFHLLEYLEKNKSKIPLLEREYLWALVAACENNVETIKRHFEEAMEKEKGVQDSINNKIKEKHELDSNLENEEVHLSAISESLRDAQGESAKRRKHAQLINLELTENTVRLKNSESVLAKNRKQMKALEDKLAKMRADDKNVCEKKKQMLQKQKDEVDASYRRVKGSLAQLNEQAKALNAQLEEVSAVEEEIQSRLNQVDRLKRDNEKELQNIQKAHSSRYQRFGPQMVKFMDLFNANIHKFKNTPRGPQGACYTVKDERYAALVEYILQGSIFQFFVDNKEDEKLLNSLVDSVYGKDEAKRNYRRPNIFNSRFKNYRLDISEGKAKCQYPTLLDMLDIVDDDDLVFNWLVDSNRVERILLFENKQQGNEFMMYPKKVPRTAIQGYSLDFYLFYATPRFKMYPKPIRHSANFIQTTKINNTLQIENEIGRLKSEYTRIQQEHRVARQKMQDVNARRGRISKEISEMKKEGVKLQSEAESLARNIEMSEAPDVASYMEGLGEVQQSVKDMEVQRDTLKSKHKELQGSLHVANSMAEETAKKVELLNCKEKKIIEERGSVNRRTNEVKKAIEKLEAQKLSIIETKEKFRKEHKDLTEQMENLKKRAKHKSVRIETDRKPQQIKDEIESLEQELKKSKFKLSQKAEVQREYENAKKTERKVDDELRIMGKAINSALPIIKLQQDHFNKKKHEYGFTLKSCFYSLTTSRQYGGLLEINHEDKTLVYLLSPDNSAELRALSNFVKEHGKMVVNYKGIRDYIGGLSGGERTFATICFMTSLWQCMECPFYVLDEFDVFMDSVNRKASQNILMYHAQNQPEAQFFLFTPLSLEDMPSRETAKVLSLQVPLRKIKPRPESDDDSEGEDEFEIKGKRPNESNGLTQITLKRIKRNPVDDEVRRKRSNTNRQ